MPNLFQKASFRRAEKVLEKVDEFIEASKSTDLIESAGSIPGHDATDDSNMFEINKPTECCAHKIRHQDFTTRLFLGYLPHQPPENSDKIATIRTCSSEFWIRTHHHDFIAETRGSSSDCPFQLVKEFFKAAYTIEDHMVAKASLTKLLTTIYKYENDEYYAFAIIIASGLSNFASHTSFHVQDLPFPSEENIRVVYQQYGYDGGSGLLKHPEDTDVARENLVMLMDIVFRRMTVKRFLIDDDFCNIFRLVHCETKGQKNKLSFIYVIFSSLLQSCLAIFCVTEVLAEYEQNQEAHQQGKYVLYILASLGSIFGFLSQLSEFRNAHKVLNFYGKFGPLQTIDFVVNVIIPLLIIIVGFWLVASQDNFVDAVIMTTALLFIPEIDDQLPGLLGFNRNAVIETYLVREAKTAYNHHICDNKVEGALSAICSRIICDSSSKMGADFNDYFISNSGHGTEVVEGSISAYQPGGNGLGIFSVNYDPISGHEISPANFMSENSLISVIEWSYSEENPVSAISWLKLVKMSGEIIEKDYASHEPKHANKEIHRLHGVFVITDIKMDASSIKTLRICGSKSARDFYDAVNYYSLWDVTEDAKSLLKNNKQSLIAKMAKEGILHDHETKTAYHAMV